MNRPIATARPGAGAALLIAALLGACAQAPDPSPAAAMPSAPVTSARVLERDVAMARVALATTSPSRCAQVSGDDAAALRRAMWRHCGAEAQGSRHACLRTLMLACA